MEDKNKGLYQKYEVTKKSNPEKKIDAIVLEFDDPIARSGIRAWARAMANEGYSECAKEVREKLLFYVIKDKKKELYKNEVDLRLMGSPTLTKDQFKNLEKEVFSC